MKRRVSSMADEGRVQTPKKPHFLQPVVSDLASNFSIPADFFKYLEGERCEEVKLRGQRRKLPWVVKIEGRRMVDGWNDFVKDNELHVGEFLLFRYEGDMLFDVTVFGLTACEKEYHLLADVDAGHDGILEDDCDVTLPDGIKRRRSYVSSHIGIDGYVATMKPSYMKSLYFPRGFTVDNKLNKATSGILIQDETGRTWPVELGFKKGTNVVYTHNLSWRPFVKEIGLREGDEFEVRVISKEMKPVISIRRLGGKENAQISKYGDGGKDWEVSKPESAFLPEPAKRLKAVQCQAQASERVSKPAHKMKLDVFSAHENETAGTFAAPATRLKENDAKRTVSHRKGRSNSTATGSVTHFSQTSTWPSIEKSRMIVNIEFMRANNLITRCGNIILKNLKGESWPAKLRYEKKRTQDTFYIGSGWRDFALSNGLGVGSQFKMEMEHSESEVLTFKLCEYIPGELKLEDDV